MRAWPVARSIFDAPLGERSERADNKLDNRQARKKKGTICITWAQDKGIICHVEVNLASIHGVRDKYIKQE